MRKSVRFITLFLLLIVCAGAWSAAPVKHADIRADLSFLPADRAERLDLFLPKQGEQWPLVIFVHGGGWVGGDKGSKRCGNIGTALIADGFAVASVNYAMPGEGQGSYLGNCLARFPQNLQDVKSAVRFLRKHADEYGYDPDRIALFGASAGAHLATLAAFTGPADGLEPSDDGHGETSSQVRAVVGFYGVYDWPALMQQVGKPIPADQAEGAKRASPLTWLDAQDPAVYAIHGTRDKHAHHSQTELLGRRLVDFGRPAGCIRIVEGAPHSFDFGYKKADVKTGVLDFLREHLKK